MELHPQVPFSAMISAAPPFAPFFFHRSKSQRLFVRAFIICQREGGWPHGPVKIMLFSLFWGWPVYDRNMFVGKKAHMCVYIYRCDYQRKFEGTSMLRTFMMAKNVRMKEWIEWIEWIDLNELNWIELSWVELLNSLELNCLEFELNWLELNWMNEFEKEVSHERFVFTSSTFRFWGKSRTKCVFES